MWLGSKQANYLKPGLLNVLLLHDEAEQQDKYEAEHGDERRDERPRFERLADRHAEVLLDQPETRVVDMGEEVRTGTDRQHHEGKLRGAEALGKGRC